jgi:hypothetical protein
MNPNEVPPILIDPEKMALMIKECLTHPVIYTLAKHSPCNPNTFAVVLHSVIFGCLYESCIGESKPDVSENQWEIKIIDRASKLGISKATAEAIEEIVEEELQSHGGLLIQMSKDGSPYVHVYDLDNHGEK